MDSRLLAGAYSQHYRALEDQNSIVTADKIDSIARAKKLSLETNKRRRSQAQKRKIEQLREEKRRHEILTKRREEQKQATEKYQRSHIPPSARQHSGRRSPRRPGGGQMLEDALRLIRGSPRHSRPSSARDRVTSPRKENEDPFEKSYFEKRGQHVTRPGSARIGHQIDQHARAELMDHSLQNFTSSKTLFEQQLEQQQNLLLEQQQKSLLEFNTAVQREIDSDVNNYDCIGDEDEKNFSNFDGSCSSTDSLEESKVSECNRSGNWSYEIQKAKSAASRTDMNQNISSAGRAAEKDIRPRLEMEHPDPRQNPPEHFYLHDAGIGLNDNQAPLNLDMTPSATYQGTLNSQGNPTHVTQTKNQPLQGGYAKDLQSDDQVHKVRINDARNGQTSNHNHPKATPLKQFSTDSLDSVSTVSTVSLVKVPAQQSSSQAQASSAKESNSASGNVAWASASKLENTPPVLPSNNVSNNNDNGPEAYNPRYASAISLSIWSGSPGNTPSSCASQTSSSSTAQSVANSSNPYGSRSTTTSITAQSVANSSQPYGSRSTTTSGASYPMSGVVPRSANNASNYSSTMVKSDAVLKSGVVGCGLSSANQIPPQNLDNNGFGMDMNFQDMQYPAMKDFNRSLSGLQSYGVIPQQQSQTNANAALSSYSQNSQLPPSTLITTKPTSVIPVPTHAVSQSPTATQPHLIQQPYQQVQQQHKQQQPLYSNLPIPQQTQHNQIDFQHQQQQQRQFQIPQCQQQQNSNLHNVHPIPGMVKSVATHGVPVPAVRTIFPHQRPPVPKTEMPETKIITSTVTARAVTQNEEQANQQSVSNQPNESKPLAIADSEQEDVENEVPRIKGILKPTPGVNPQQPTTKIGGHPRDSLEVMRLQGDKKGKKKSVRFADDSLQDTAEEVKGPLGTRNMVITNSGVPVQKPAVSRPASARVISTTQRTDTAISKVARAASAGTTRQVANLPSQLSLTRNGQAQTSDLESATSARDIQLSSPSNGTAINRPKAAAHIIMSNPEHQGLAEKSGGMNGVGSPAAAAQAASIAHKSLLDSKVKNINSPSFMGSRAPVRIPGPASAVSVYYVARAGEEDLGANYQLQQQQQAFAIESGSNIGPPVSNYSSIQDQRQRLRDPSPASKPVPISNSVVTRTSIVPASTKISIPQANMGTPSYSSSTAGGGGGGNSGTSGAVYDENGMRIDRTPTDEEITWLWDKVRTCLNKEEQANGGATGNAKVQNGGGGGGVDPGRPPPTMSTKLIDGASLGFGMSTTPGVNGLRVGAGFFQPHNSPSVQNNKVRPALQQQGSYLRRYGLLKQRRVNSASSLGSAQSQPPVAGQRASSAVHTRQHHQTSVISPTNQQMEQDGPQPIAQAYIAQDGVSESTAAFIMAERLAKQSLSDSHIQSGMQDAHTKQEMHNTRSARLAVNRGHSALSIEEQNLLASLDKLNERLRVTDTHYTGTIQYHQPYQAHLPGFRSNQSHMPENKRNQNHSPLSPRSLNQAQQRAQSARIRQQTRQYR